MDSGGFWAIVLIVRVICAFIAMAIAGAKGRSKVGWFFAGFFIDIIGIIIVACLSNKKEEAARFSKIEQDRRRLREQLRQEQIKSEAFRLHAAQRLDAHDRTLGVDTRQTVGLLPGTGQTTEALPGSPEQALASMDQTSTVPAMPPVFVPPDSPVWFYEISGQSRGPVRETDILALIQQGAVKSHTLLWRQGFDDWTPANQVDQFIEAVT